MNGLNEERTYVKHQKSAKSAKIQPNRSKGENRHLLIHGSNGKAKKKHQTRPSKSPRLFDLTFIS